MRQGLCLLAPNTLAYYSLTPVREKLYFVNAIRLCMTKSFFQFHLRDNKKVVNTL
jgi:hypothetical protein